MSAARARAQVQFDGLLAKYPERTAGHPDVADIFPPTYPLFDVTPTRRSRE
jgi:hypothetical protein